MNPGIQVILGTTLIAAGVGYAWWTRLRVWMLRQDLFAIRDALWDSMRAKGELDDPAHRECREGINAMIRLAPYLSLISVWRILAIGIHARMSPMEADIPTEVEEARNRVFIRIARYLLYWTLMGWVAVMILSTFRSLRLANAWLTRKVEALFDSQEIIVIDRRTASQADKHLSPV